MSVPEATGRFIDRYMARIVLFCVLGTCACIGVLTYQQVQLNRQQGQVRDQSVEGQRARERQQAVYPVSVKLYVDAEHRGVITRDDLACFQDSRRCPSPTP